MASGVKRKLTKEQLIGTTLWRDVFASDEEHESSLHEDAAGQKRRRRQASAETESARDSLDQEKDKDTATKKDGNNKKRKASEPEEDLSLADVIKLQPKLVSNAVKGWLERYEKEADPATCELLMAIFETCGVSFRTDEEELLQESVDEVVRKLVDQVKQGDVEDYISSKQRELRGFKENLAAFWEAFVFECRTGPLFDERLMEKLMGYVTVLACSPPRVVRHVATLIGLQLVTSFINVAKNLCQARETKQRQLNAEKKKRKEGPRVESLSKLLSETHEKITKLEEMMRSLFQGLFMHRYRDVDADIRLSCIRAIGLWIINYPSLFLDDKYLKYLGWMLNDKNAGVRKTALDSLQALYEIDDNLPSLKLFTTRFSKRMLEMANDVDLNVAVAAIGLLKQLLRHQRAGDNESLDVTPVYDLLIDESPQIRHAVGQLVYEQMIAQPGSEDEDSEKSEVQLRKLLNILGDFAGDPILCNYVIDAVWDEMKSMQDWKCLTSMLLDDSRELQEVDATNLCRILSASARKAVGLKTVAMGDGRKPTLSKAQKDAVDSSKKRLTSVMIKTHTDLLRKFLADTAKVPFIVEVVQCLNLELYSLKQQQQNGKLTLELAKEAFFKHGDRRTLKSCVEALAFCVSQGEGDLPDAARRVLKETWEEVVSKLKSAIHQAGETEDDYSMTVNLRRLQHLLLSLPPPNEGLYEDMLTILEDFSDLDDEVVELVLLNMFLQVLWCLKGLDYEDPARTQMADLRAKRAKLSNYLDTYTDSVLASFEEGNGMSRSSLSCTICSIFSDLCSLFHEEKLGSTTIETLGFTPSSDSVKKFWELCRHRLSLPDGKEDPAEVQEEGADSLNPKDVVMTAAAKLVAHNLVPKDLLAPEVVSHYVLHGKAVEETIKQLIFLLRKNMKSPELCNMFLEAMKKAYRRYVDEEDETLKGRYLEGAKELAVRLSATFSGVARNVHKASLLKSVKKGVDYAFEDVPNQLPFLEICLLPFCQRLPVADIRDIIENVKAKVQESDVDEDQTDWQSYLNFVDQLKDRASKTEVPAKQKKNKIPKGKKLFEGDHSEDEEEPSRSEEEDEIENDEDDDDTPLYQVRARMKAAARDDNVHTMRTRNKAAVRHSAPATEEQLPE